MNEKFRSVLYPLATFVALVALWEVAIRVFKVPNYILPTPYAVVEALQRGYIEGLFWKHFLFTLQSMVLGYVLGCSLAFLLGCLEFGEERYFDAFCNVLHFSLDHLHDPVFGEWYHSVEEEGTTRDATKGSAWKAAYHVTQALAYADGYLKEIAGA